MSDWFIFYLKKCVLQLVLSQWAWQLLFGTGVPYYLYMVVVLIRVKFFNFCCFQNQCTQLLKNNIWYVDSYHI